MGWQVCFSASSKLDQPSPDSPKARMRLGFPPQPQRHLQHSPHPSSRSRHCGAFRSTSTSTSHRLRRTHSKRHISSRIASRACRYTSTSIRINTSAGFALIMASMSAPMVAIVATAASSPEPALLTPTHQHHQARRRMYCCRMYCRWILLLSLYDDPTDLKCIHATMMATATAMASSMSLQTCQSSHPSAPRHNTLWASHRSS